MCEEKNVFVLKSMFCAHEKYARQGIKIVGTNVRTVSTIAKGVEREIFKRLMLPLCNRIEALT